MRRLGQCVVENSWVLDADHVRKVLKHDLLHYEKIIDPASYKVFQQRMANIKNKTWYSKMMTIDALTYILCSATITAGLEDLRIREERAVEMGKPWSEEDRKMYHDTMFSTALREWSVKATKLAALLNPEYGDFLKACGEMHEYCEREKREGRTTVGCGLDKARMFTAIFSLNPVLRCNLLEAQCKPELRKASFHPPGFSDSETKQWCHTWSMWDCVERMARNLLSGCFDEICGNVPLHRVETFGGDVDLLREQILEDFKYFAFQVRSKFFRSIWISKPGEKFDADVLRRRSKQFVFCFFVEREVYDANYFWCYPACFTGWAVLPSACDEEGAAPEYSMYPVEGTNPKRKLTPWEIENCPWYLESDQWSIAFDQNERTAFARIAKGEEPKYGLLEMKFGPPERKLEVCAILEGLCLRQGVLIQYFHGYVFLLTFWRPFQG